MTLEAPRTLHFNELRVGMRETYSRLITSEDVIAFAEVSGDRNPIHLSDEFAAKTPFTTRIAHGIYTASLISAVIGTRLPGPGAIYMTQSLKFLAPVHIGDTVDATVEVTELSERGRRATLACVCRVGDTIVMEGEAMVKVPARPIS